MLTCSLAGPSFLPARLSSGNIEYYCIKFDTCTMSTPGQKIAATATSVRKRLDEDGNSPAWRIARTRLFPADSRAGLCASCPPFRSVFVACVPRQAVDWGGHFQIMSRELASQYVQKTISLLRNPLEIH